MADTVSARRDTKTGPEGPVVHSAPGQRRRALHSVRPVTRRVGGCDASHPNACYMETNYPDSNRKSWADLCRVAAIFGVVVIHACGANFYQFGKIPSADWLSINLLDSLVRCSVPLFVMLSGALLLSPQASPATPWQILGRIRKVAIPLLTWNVAYLLYVSRFTGQGIDWLGMFRQVPMYHLWFVYMIIGLYLLLPVLQAIFTVIAQRPDLQRYLLALWVVVTCVPIYYPLPILALLQQTSLLGYAGFFLMGGVIAGAHSRGAAWPWALAYLVAVLVTCWVTWRDSTAAQSVVERAYLYFSPNVVLASLGAFILFTRLEVRGLLSRGLHWIADRSFLVFFMHVVILERVQNHVAAWDLSMPVILQTVLVSVLTFLLCLAIASLLRLLPKSRAILG